MNPVDYHFINVSLPLLSASGLYEITVSNGKFEKVTMQQERIASGDFHPCFGRTMPEGGGKWDLEGRVMLPGFVDSHMHLDKSFSLPRVPNVSGTLREALSNYNAAYAEIEKDDIKARMKKAALRSLAYGSTTLRTHLDFNLRIGKDIAFRTIHAALEVKEELKDLVDIQLFPLTIHDSLGSEEMDAVEEALVQGVTGIGAIPHFSRTPEADVENIFTLAAKYDCPVDLHTDEDDDPSVRTVAVIADAAEKYDYQGRVVVGHLCSLAGMDHAAAAELIGKMKKAGLGAVTLPAANMYLQGRGDRGIVRRGITRVREILEAGVPIATASDNIHDPFHPFGRGDMIQIGLLTGYAAHFGSPEEQRTILRMMTEIPASIIGLADYGIAPRNQADFVILDACTTEEIFTFLPENRAVFKKGKLIHSSKLQSDWTVAVPG